MEKFKKYFFRKKRVAFTLKLLIMEMKFDIHGNFEMFCYTIFVYTRNVTCNAKIV